MRRSGKTKSRVAATILGPILVCLGLLSSGIAQEHPQSGPSRSCDACHTCQRPAADNPCLRPCLRASPTGAVDLANDHGPGLVTLDMLKDVAEGVDRFGPVPFNHAGHATMPGGCAVCHHFTPKGAAHPACRTCHELHLQRDDIRKPSLKGAYHRQCMGCHREWAHETDCDVCHLPQDGRPATADLERVRTYMAHEHPVVPEPNKEVYETEHEDGTRSRVVFHHKAHAHTYGFACVDCHQKDSCLRCHEEGREHVQRKRTLEEHHQPCSACHLFDRQEGCHYCHRREGEPPARPFDHANTGWPLGPYHEDKDCRDCHTQLPFASLSGACNSCHSVHALDQYASGRDCIDCHNPHEAWYGYIRTAADADLCLRCHVEFGAGPAAGMHPLGRMDVPVPQELIDAGAQVGSDPCEVTCVVCHSTSTARLEPVLADTADPDALCEACHPEQASVVGTAHDLRTRFPEPIRLTGGAQPRVGACSPCHQAHGLMRTSAPAPGDAPGRCTACHRTGGCAQSSLPGEVMHPDTVCSDCHDPHERGQPAFLTRPTPELCAECHEEQFTIVGGPHDRRTNPGAWPERASDAGGLCLPCHLAHGGQRPDLYRFGSAEHDSYHDDACLSCHPKAGWNADSPIAIIHPHEISPDQHKVELALVPKDDQGNMRMGCRTCHNPHGGPDPVHLARVEPDQPTEELCLHCHVDQKHVLLSGHSWANLSKLGYDVDSCKPCHAMHAERDGAWGQMLSPRFLMENCEYVAEGIEGCVPCLACHHTGGPAPLRDVFTHPEVALTNIIPRTAEGFLPLFDAQGHVDPQGQVVCRTCHLAHGWVPPGEDPRAVIKNLTPEEQRARRFALRPFEPPNVCTECHGAQGRWAFLFFHDPERRKGPGQLAGPKP
jgi:predicted CXXCH cytochrome family protein